MKKSIILLFISFVFCSCEIKKEDALFVSNKKKYLISDTLKLNEDGLYLRWCEDLNGNKAIDSGKWYYEDNSLWFYSWTRRGEMMAEYTNYAHGLTSFSFNKSISGSINKIYFSLDDSYYFKKVE